MITKKTAAGIVLTALALLSLSGCSNDGPAIAANPQSISFGTAPPLALGSTATVTASASSGLAVSFSSSTPTVCSVNSSSGVVTDISVGTCIIAANQSGNTLYATAPQATQALAVIFNPNQTISFAAAPSLSVFSTATVSATSSSGLAVRYSSTTPNVCSIDAGTGLVKGLAGGSCIVAADQAGNANFNPAPQVTQTITVAVPSTITVPGTPTGVAVTAGSDSKTVTVTVGATTSGGSPITGYTVTSAPSGITETATALPFTVSCPSSCAGYAFSVVATNSSGNGVPSALTDIITTYNVVETFYEPDTQPNNSIFIGSFTFNATTGTVSGLHGNLSESMTGGSTVYPNDTMTWLTLNNQLSAEPVTLGGVNGLLVTTFLLPTTNTFTTAYGGTNGWAPGTGFATYYGYPGAPNPKAGGIGNAYAMIFVNTTDPTAALAKAQIDKLAYADCAAGGMMSSVCMTGTTIAGYGSVGSMSGHPISQIIMKGVAE